MNALLGFVFLLDFTINYYASANHASYGYSKTNGPRTWEGKFPTCGGTKQSPINLDTSRAIIVNQPYIMWWQYSVRPKSIEVVNVGHTVMLKFKWNNENEIPYHWFAPGDHPYIFHHFHFHWGPSDASGSEHTLNGEKFPLEMHLVHFRKEFETIENAFDKERGLRVVGILFRLSTRNNPILTSIVDVLDDVREPESSSFIAPFPLSYILPEFSRQYLTYNGSLTTPPCAESVTWVVPKQTTYVSSSQMTAFRTLLGHQGSMISNYRPPQPLNGRSIWHIR